MRNKILRIGFYIVLPFFMLGVFLGNCFYWLLLKL